MRSEAFIEVAIAKVGDRRRGRNLRSAKSCLSPRQRNLPVQGTGDLLGYLLNLMNTSDSAIYLTTFDHLRCPAVDASKEQPVGSA